MLMGLSDCDGDGHVPFRKFAKLCVEYIDEHFKFDKLCKKQNLLKLHQSTIEPKHKQVVKLDEMELFRTFKKYDRNQNGMLEFSEYTQCLSECEGLDLTKQEIISTALSADLNCDGHIDFEEFMKHFTDILNMLSFNQQMNFLMKSAE